MVNSKLILFAIGFIGLLATAFTDIVDMEDAYYNQLTGVLHCSGIDCPKNAVRCKVEIETPKTDKTKLITHSICYDENDKILKESKGLKSKQNSWYIKGSYGQDIYSNESPSLYIDYMTTNN